MFYINDFLSLLLFGIITV